MNKNIRQKFNNSHYMIQTKRKYDKQSVPKWMCYDVFDRTIKLFSTNRYVFKAVIYNSYKR